MNKLPMRYWYAFGYMEGKLLKRLIATTSKSLKPARFAAMYGASWRMIATRRLK